MDMLVYKPSILDSFQKNKYRSMPVNPDLQKEERIAPKSETFSVLIEGPYGVCSGTLVSKKHVLTAAHCMVPSGECVAIHKVMIRPEDYTVFALGTCRSKPNKPCPSGHTEAKKFNVTALHILNEYFEKCKTGDLAILTLSIPEGQPDLPHASFPFKGRKHSFGEYTVSGWGFDPINPENSGSRVTSANVTVVPCKESHNDHICIKEDETNACEGDSGAGLLDGNTIIGVVSYGTDCKTLFQRGVYRLEHQQAKLSSMTDGVFTAVSTHTEFICKVITPEPCTVTADSELDEGYTRLPPLDENDYSEEYDN
uniref:Peptidase S1 domain-containing protein n=1 Tax=Panagrellus redivivus TaxID=6233 RepID=A0A7E4ZTQ9_PANRE